MYRRSRLRGASLALLGALALAGNAAAEYGRTPESHVDLSTLAIDQAKYLGAPLERGLALIDASGDRFTLGDMLGKPLLLLLSYYSCDGVCPTMNRKLAEAIAQVKRFRSGQDFRVLTASFDRNDRPEAIRHFESMAGIEDPAGQGWRLALFADSADIKRLTEAVGFRYFWSARDRVFMHPNVLIVLSPEGRVARYLPAATLTARDIELALIESDWNRIANSTRVLDLVSGVCFSYSYKDGRYVLNAPLFIAAGSLTLGLGAVVLSFSVFRKFKHREVRGA